MGYVIEPITATSFIEDKKIKLPRFQRKSTWNDKQNFELAISIFQGYPVGVVIINKEKDLSWLLDGRQRRTALKTMRENPVELYKWATKFLKFKKSDDEIEIKRIFNSKVSAYLQAEDEVDIEEDYEIGGTEEENSFNVYDQKRGLNTLQELILMVHKKQKNSLSAWEKLFDFREYFEKLKYVKNIEGTKTVEPISLRKFLLELAEEYDNDPSLQQFEEYYLENFSISEDKKNKFLQEIELKWPHINNSIKTLIAAENIFQEVRVGVIQLTNVSPLDAQNIFSRINSGGTKLKAEELLSAKPFWNIPYETSNNELQSSVKELYKKLEVDWDGELVRWDAAAVLISNIDKNRFIFDWKSKENEIDIDAVTLGFKLLSLQFIGGMSSNHVSQLETNKEINWSQDIRIFEKDLTQVINFLLKDKYFKYLGEWNYPLSKLLGKAPALEFLLITYKDWKDRSEPSVNSGEGKAVQRNARILLDRLIYEYSIRRWAGSSDSKVANDIKEWKQRLRAIEDEQWKNFIYEVCRGSYGSSPVRQSTLTPVLYYFQVLKEAVPKGSVEKYEIDHLYPKEKFTGNNMINQNYKDSLTNLIILPKEANNEKRNRSLKEIEDNKILVKNIVETSGINLENFDEYSDLANFEKLIAVREKYFYKILDRERRKYLSN